MTPQETDPDLPVSVQEALAEVWVNGGLLQGRGTECSSARVGPFEGPLSSLPEPQFGLRSSNMEGTQPRPSTENWVKNLLSMVPPSEQDLVSPSVSLSGRFHKPLILFHQRADRMKTKITEN